MPNSKYLKLTIGNKVVQVTDPSQLPISIDYALEDPDNFESKPSSQALEVEVPATLLNDVAANTFRNPGIKDLTDGNIFRSNQPFILDENGLEIMKGKAFLASAKHNAAPISYTYNFFGDNSDWKIDLQEATLYDFLKNINFIFNKANIMASWAFDGTNPNLPYVFVPIRYRDPMGGYSTDDSGNQTPIDDNMLPEYMKPCISKYWLLFWAFKSVGYKIKSDFFDSSYFRRQVMPWTWGSFLGSDGTLLDTHRFLAKSSSEFYYNAPNGRNQFFIDAKVTLDTQGAFENNPGDYTYDSVNKEMKWTYNAPDYGKLATTFDMQVQYNARLNHNTSDITLTVYWYKNEVQIGQSRITRVTGKEIGPSQDVNIADVFSPDGIIVEAGDTISAKLWLDIKAAKLGYAAINVNVLSLQPYFKTPLEGTIAISNYTGFKNYKFLDFLKGVISEFNLSINTDSVNKVVTIEPTHQYSVVNDLTQTNQGYFVNDFISWDGKEDLLQQWEMDNYSDYERELTFKFKDDSNDGILKLIQDRNTVTLASGKYVFPDRFKAGKKDIENPFFAATMHYEVIQWKGLGTGSNVGIAPQMICMVPENVSNTSNSASDNTFIPKSIYYKGNIAGVGAWKFDGTVYQTFPFAFAVNYKPGGENDPILSYSDENINNVIAKGLLKRFYWKRLAIMRNGQWYNTFFRLKNVDVVNCLHREYKSYAGQRWELIKISGYKPLQEKSTAVLLRRWEPVSVDDFNYTFPSAANVTDGSGTNSFDIKYNPLKALITDIPTE